MLPQSEYEGLSDNDLARRARDDLECFSLLFHRFFTPVYRYFFFRLRDRDDAEDLTSETFEKVFRKLGTFQERGSPFSAWLFAVAHRCLLDHLRRKKLPSVPIDALEAEKEPRCEMDLGALDRAMLSQHLWNAVRTLPEKYQQLWNLKLSADLSHRAIAEMLGTTENNVNVMVHRSTAHLKRRLSHLSPHG